MRAVKTSTADGRNAYKTTGGTKVQPVYKRVRGKYVHDKDGALIVEKWRVIRYGWTMVNGVKTKTKPVSILVDQNPQSMTPSQQRALERDLADLLAHSLTSVELIRDATEKLRSAMEDGMDATSEHFRKSTRKVLRLLEQDNRKDSATNAAIAEFLDVAHQYAQTANLKATTLGEQVAEEERRIKAAKEALAKAKRLSSFGLAAIGYLADREGVKAGDTTRRVYGSYLKNHLLVPTATGREAIGDLTIPEITKDILTSFEKSLYKARRGYTLKHSLTDISSIASLRALISSGEPLPRIEQDQIALRPDTAEKIIAFITSVIEWAMQEPAKWGLAKYHINLAAKYKMNETAPQKRKTFAPRTVDFNRIIRAAEELDLGYMVPLLVLTRCSFRPSESRAIKWSDVIEVDNYGKRMPAAVLRGTIRHTKGKGEHFAPLAKTAAALNDPVVIPKTMMELLKKHRVAGCEYVVPPAPVKPGVKNSNRKVKPFLTKDAYAEAWQKIKTKVGLPEGTDMYTLKHGMIAELLLQGWSSKAICLMTRHTTETMIDRIYAAIQSGDLAEAIDGLSVDVSAELLPTPPAVSGDAIEPLS